MISQLWKHDNVLQPGPPPHRIIDSIKMVSLRSAQLGFMLKKQTEKTNLSFVRGREKNGQKSVWISYRGWEDVFFFYDSSLRLIHCPAQETFLPLAL